MGIVATQVYGGGGYDPNSAVFSTLTGSPDAPGSGMAINPATGKLEQVYATYAAPEPDSAIAFGAESRRYFASDFDRPASALSLAGYAPGYYDHSEMDLLEYGVLGGLAAIGGVAAYSVATGAAGSAIYGGSEIGGGVVTGAGEVAATTEVLASAGETVAAEAELIASATPDMIASGAEGVIADSTAYTASEGVLESQVYGAAGASAVAASTAVETASIGATLANVASTVLNVVSKVPLLAKIVSAATGGGTRTAAQPRYLPQQNLSDGLLNSIYGEAVGPSIGDAPKARLNPWIIAGVGVAFLLILVALFRR